MNNDFDIHHSEGCWFVVERAKDSKVRLEMLLQNSRVRPFENLPITTLDPVLTLFSKINHSTIMFKSTSTMASRSAVSCLRAAVPTRQLVPRQIQPMASLFSTQCSSGGLQNSGSIRSQVLRRKRSSAIQEAFKFGDDDDDEGTTSHAILTARKKGSAPPVIEEAPDLEFLNKRWDKLDPLEQEEIALYLEQRMRQEWSELSKEEKQASKFFFFFFLRKINDNYNHKTR